MVSLFRDIFRFRDLLFLLVLRNLKIRYKNSVLGFLWTLLGPVFLIVVYAVFLRLLRFYQPGDPNFLPMLVTGIIVWQFFAMCLGDSLHAIVGNASLITKTAFPRIILPIATVLANLANFLLSTAVLLVFLKVMGCHIGPWYWYPAVLLTHVALCLGMALFLSAINVYFRDTEHLLSVVLLAWFFMTPVIYTFDLIPASYHAVAALNPMTGLVAAYRTLFMSLHEAPAALLRVSFAVCWAVFVLGLVTFVKLQPRFAEEL